jgi:hypothetical protein
VHDGLNPLQRTADCQRVADVGRDQFGLVRQVGRPASGLAVHLGREAVENTDQITPLEEEIGKMGADETGSACDQNPPHCFPSATA